MVARTWGQTRNLDERTVDPPDLPTRRTDGRGWPGAPRYGDRHEIPDMGTDTMSDIPIRNVQRETFNSQRPMVVTERAHGRRDMGTDTKFGRPDF